MRVNVQYGVELDEVPVEIQRLLDQAAEQLENLLHTAHKIKVVGGNPYLAHEEIEKIRLALPSFDTSLEDIQSLLKGYQAALTQLMLSPDSGTLPDVPLTADSLGVEPTTHPVSVETKEVDESGEKHE